MENVKQKNMSDGITQAHKDSDDVKRQSSIAQELLSFLEDPTPTRMTELKTITKAMESSPEKIEQIALRLDQNDPEEWKRFHRSNAFSGQSDDFKKRFFLNVEKRNIPGI